MTLKLPGPVRPGQTSKKTASSRVRKMYTFHQLTSFSYCLGLFQLLFLILKFTRIQMGVILCFTQLNGIM